jgi:hypothetical protein
MWKDENELAKDEPAPVIVCTIVALLSQLLRRHNPELVLERVNKALRWSVAAGRVRVIQLGS